MATVALPDPSAANCPDALAALIPATYDLPVMVKPPGPSLIRCALPVTLPVARGAMSTTAGETLTVTADLPAPNDGGAEDSAAPQPLPGRGGRGEPHPP